MEFRPRGMYLRYDHEVLKSLSIEEVSELYRPLVLKSARAWARPSGGPKVGPAKQANNPARWLKCMRTHSTIGQETHAVLIMHRLLVCAVPAVLG
eukprot:jgi/Botrbrau1/22664/Bobra.0132s0010.1